MDKELALAIFNAQTDMVIITIGGEEIERCNNAFLSFFEYKTLEEFKKNYKCICELFVEEDGYLQKEQNNISWIDELLSRDDKSAKVKIVFRKKEYIFLIKAASIEHDSKKRVAVSLHDYTDLETKAISLGKELESKNSDIIKMNSIFKLSEEYLNIGIFELDVDSKKLIGSDGFYHILDLDKKNAVTIDDVLKRVSSLDITDIETSIVHMLEHFTEGAYSFKIVTSDGSLKFIKAYFKPKVIDRRKKFVGFFQDNTQKYLLEKLQDQQESMDFLKHKIKSQKEMLNSIAHHWRQPLTAISLTINNIEFEMEEKCILDNKIVDMLESVTDKAQFLSKTINEFINISSLKESKVSMEIKREIQRVINLNSPFYEEKGIKISVFSNKEIHLTIFKEELLNIIESSILNSVESIEKKRSIPQYQDLQGSVEIHINEIENRCCIEIRDNGVGISNIDAQKVFEPYYTTKFMNPGVGLSLYFAKVIINTHFDGDIYFNTNIDNGAILVIELGSNTH
ncbi:MAG: sensor histidine kinase [Campylobacterales bacterium]